MSQIIRVCSFILLGVIFFIGCSPKKLEMSKEVKVEASQTAIATVAYKIADYGIVLKNMPGEYNVSEKIENEGDFEEAKVYTIKDKDGQIMAKINISAWNNASSLALGDTGLKIAGEDAVKEEAEVKDWEAQPVKVNLLRFESMNADIICNIYVRMDHADWIIQSLIFEK